MAEWNPIKDMFNKVNFIFRFLQDPCDAPFTFYAQSAIPAAMDAIVTYYALDITDIVANYLRPRQAIARTRSGRKGGRGKKGGRMRRTPWSMTDMIREERLDRRTGQIITQQEPPSRARRAGQFALDPWGELGKMLPGAEFLNARKVTKGIIVLWIVFDTLSVWLWWFFIVSLAIDFLYDWLSMVQKSSYCEAQRATVILATDDGYTIIAVVESFPALAQNIEKQRGYATWTGGGGSIGDLSAVCVYSCTVTPGPLGFKGTLCFIRGADVDGRRSTSDRIELAPGTNGEATVNFSVAGPSAYLCRWYDLEGSATVTDCVFSLISTI